MNYQIKKFLYGDIPEEKGGGNINSIVTKNDWPLWEVFIRSKQGLDHKHVGSLHATNPDDAAELYEPSMDKIYRHPTFYDLPDEVKHM